MHIFFSGIGGTAIGPLALIAHQAGHDVSGSDKQESQYIDYLKKQGLKNITIGQSEADIRKVHEAGKIDWLVYSSAVAIENPDHAELKFAEENHIKATKRDELLNKIIKDSGQKLIAVAGTHGKTTTTAMAIWLFRQMGLPISWSVGAKIPFGDMGHFDPEGEYFIYECDEFDRNFLSFSPDLSIITGIDYDHHEIYPTREDYVDAFKQFLDQSERAVMWQSDLSKNKIKPRPDDIIMDDYDRMINSLSIAGEVNRRDALQVIEAFRTLKPAPYEILVGFMEMFPGLSRRFEKLPGGPYTDYAHTIPKIKGCLQMASELSQEVVVIYEPLTNRRQHYIKGDYAGLFEGVKKLYWVPSYMAREDPAQTVLSPQELIGHMKNAQIAEPAGLNDDLKQKVQKHLDQGDLVVGLSGGGGGSLDEWLRKEFS